MANFTSNTYTLKRKILTFTNKISKQLSKPDRKFTADITYGMLASQSCLLTDVVDQLFQNYILRKLKTQEIPTISDRKKDAIWNLPYSICTYSYWYGSFIFFKISKQSKVAK